MIRYQVCHSKVRSTCVQCDNRKGRGIPSHMVSWLLYDSNLILLNLLLITPPAHSWQYNSLTTLVEAAPLMFASSGPPKRDCPADVTSLLIIAVCEFCSFMTLFLWFAKGREFHTFTTFTFLLSIAPICDLTICWGHVGIEAAKPENP